MTAFVGYIDFCDGEDPRAIAADEVEQFENIVNEHMAKCTA